MKSKNLIAKILLFAATLSLAGCVNLRIEKADILPMRVGQSEQTSTRTLTSVKGPFQVFK